MIIEKKKKINLLSQDYREPKNYKKLTQISIGILAVYITALTCLFGLTYLLKQQKNTQVLTNKNLSSSVKSQKETEELLLTLKSRTSVAQSIFSKSVPTADLIDNAVKLLPEGVSLSSVEVDKEGKIALVVKSANSSGFSRLVNKFKEYEFQQVVLKTLALSGQSYIISLDLKQ